ncbi:RelA/SpoT domain-containing protein [Kocuria sp. HSID16901]|uniref:RelA/SpoT domain-containing protein n=1 Tax=Kocuria sp. HSID16901 TaxID=2419505 RepID=UPI000660A5F9|nr:RelA/SpoT domain-containing protein [Kocuria sp. HSID16901]MCT1368417.1 RelA/SpoT domain-containing protein [Rothia sp. p3-SID1597]RUQ23499.1 hypothetical protein D8M21_02010 [Kocuria sp. HSID16901]
MSDMPSKSSVSKAGSRIRKYFRGEITQGEYAKALDTLREYRACFAMPTVTVNMYLRRLLEKQEIDGQVSQRLKKVPTILEKLTERETTLDLARLHDIGGCRVVVEDIATVRRLEALIRDDPKNYLVRERDYVSDPRYSGYRAVHLVVNRNESLPVEVQLRSRVMHQWAETAEGFSKELGVNFKQDGDHVVQRFLAVASDIFGRHEVGQAVEPELRARYSELLPEVEAVLLERDQLPLF